MSQLLQEFDRTKHATGRSKEVIEGQAKIRSSVEGISRQIKKLKDILETQTCGSKKSANRRNVSDVELQERRHCVNMLSQELQNIQDYQRSGAS